jgi:hypothetical protein
MGMTCCDFSVQEGLLNPYFSHKKKIMATDISLREKRERL